MQKKNEGGLVSKLSEKWNTIFIVGHVLTVNLSFLFIGEKSVVAAVQLLLRIDPVWRLQTFATLFFSVFFKSSDASKFYTGMFKKPVQASQDGVLELLRKWERLQDQMVLLKQILVEI